MKWNKMGNRDYLIYNTGNRKRIKYMIFKN